jgi:hypothetical protein
MERRDHKRPRDESSEDYTVPSIGLNGVETGEREVVGKVRRGEVKLATLDKDRAVVAAAAPEGEGCTSTRVQIQTEFITDLMRKNVEIREKRLGTAIEINGKCNTKKVE